LTILYSCESLKTSRADYVDLLNGALLFQSIGCDSSSVTTPSHCLVPELRASKAAPNPFHCGIRTYQRRRYDFSVAECLILGAKIMKPVTWTPEKDLNEDNCGSDENAWAWLSDSATLCNRIDDRSASPVVRVQRKYAQATLASRCCLSDDHCLRWENIQ
jgi:hypothetical protein